MKHSLWVHSVTMRLQWHKREPPRRNKGSSRIGPNIGGSPLDETKDAVETVCTQLPVFVWSGTKVLTSECFLTLWSMKVTTTGTDIDETIPDLETPRFIVIGREPSIKGVPKACTPLLFNRMEVDTIGSLQLGEYCRKSNNTKNIIRVIKETEAPQAIREISLSRKWCPTLWVIKCLFKQTGNWNTNIL